MKAELNEARYRRLQSQLGHLMELLTATMAELEDGEDKEWLEETVVFIRETIDGLREIRKERRAQLATLGDVAENLLGLIRPNANSAPREEDKD